MDRKYSSAIVSSESKEDWLREDIVIKHDGGRMVVTDGNGGSIVWPRGMEIVVKHVRPFVAELETKRRNDDQ